MGRGEDGLSRLKVWEVGFPGAGGALSVSGEHSSAKARRGKGSLGGWSWVSEELISISICLFSDLVP